MELSQYLQTLTHHARALPAGTDLLIEFGAKRHDILKTDNSNKVKPAI